MQSYSWMDKYPCGSYETQRDFTDKSCQMNDNLTKIGGGKHHMNTLYGEGYIDTDELKARTVVETYTNIQRNTDMCSIFVVILLVLIIYFLIK